MLIEELPLHLRERTRACGARRSPDGGGELVLYWMHHAVRAEENPALDAARIAAARLELPLLVYQGLGGRHRYDSDRHHRFIMEGARDAAAALLEMRVRHVFHLARDPGMPTPLRALAARAALVVTEDVPVPPMTAWTRALARSVTAPLWLVDCACVLPMRLTPRAYARAFEFRRAHGDEQLERAARGWPRIAQTPLPFEGELGFEPLDLASADLAALCAQCAIDHTVPPVTGTEGGARAALARWSRFREAGLASYDRLRNDAAVPWPLGASRMSPYLHHGHVSPLRVAREASEARDRGSAGARKFLDELLVWRELAHGFCFHDESQPGGLESLARLPAWARDTLSAHARDPRTPEIDAERLERARTGDRLWDAAQRSLLVRGELHNNLRMTWAKAILGWTRSPEAALSALIDLNHRYALDGSDPNSYGGLLYALGLFDRPFEPERAVFGTVRTRPTAGHTRRLDLDAFERSTRRSRPAGGVDSRVAVIGAGIAGLAAARALGDQGVEVEVIERSARVGGRAAHRDRDGERFDHGAQYFTARDPRFSRWVERWEDLGVVAPWGGRIVAIGPDGEIRESGRQTRFVGVPGMRAVGEHLARDLDVQTGCNVAGVRREGGHWRIDLGSGGERRFAAVVLAMPPEQCRRVLGPALQAPALDESASLPCWAAMASFDAPLPIPFDGAFLSDGPLAWIARDSSKPGRPEGERWLMHSAPEWAAARLDAPPALVAADLLDALFRVSTLSPRSAGRLRAHRWSFARPGPAPAGGATAATGGTAARACLELDAGGPVLCGDWCVGGRVEGAFLSGCAAAGAVLARLS